MNQAANYGKKLPYSTAECDAGPIIEAHPGKVVVRYDHPESDGIIWTQIIFSSAVAYRFTPDSASTELHVKAYSRICEITDSEWLNKLRQQAQLHGLTIGKTLRHFMIYFDHHGSFEVIAEIYDIAG